MGNSGKHAIFFWIFGERKFLWCVMLPGVFRLRGGDTGYFEPFPKCLFSRPSRFPHPRPVLLNFPSSKLLWRTGSNQFWEILRFFSQFYEIARESRECLTPGNSFVLHSSNIWGASRLKLLHKLTFGSDRFCRKHCSKFSKISKFSKKSNPGWKLIRRK